jgi:ABC-type thiamine transport system substrate-binding protein
MFSAIHSVKISALFPAKLYKLTHSLTHSWSKACTAFTRSEAGIVGSNPTQGMDVWCAFFCVCVQVRAL